MNGIERITDKIKADAQSELAALRAEREAQFAAVAADQRADADKCYQELSARYHREGEQQLERLKSAVDMDAKKQTLALKQQLISESFARAEQKLAALKGEPYVALLARLAAEAASGEGEQVVLSEADRAAYGPAVVERANALLAAAGKPASLTLADACQATGGGLILRSGRLEINCTFSALVARQRDPLASEVAKLLFPLT